MLCRQTSSHRLSEPCGLRNQETQLKSPAPDTALAQLSTHIPGQVQRESTNASQTRQLHDPEFPPGFEPVQQSYSTETNPNAAAESSQTHTFSKAHRSSVSSQSLPSMSDALQSRACFTPSRATGRNPMLQPQLPTTPSVSTPGSAQSAPPLALSSFRYEVLPTAAMTSPCGSLLGFPAKPDSETPWQQQQRNPMISLELARQLPQSCCPQHRLHKLTD